MIRGSALTVLAAVAAIVIGGCCCGGGSCGSGGVCGVDASAGLASWRDVASRRAIERFVEDAVDPSSGGYIEPGDRIAVFDNDGTLWAEKPVYAQLSFALDRVRAMADDHPEWRTTEPFKSALSGDMASLAKQGERAILELVVATHSGMSASEFAGEVESWLATARHPTTGRAYTAMVYEPMLELLGYLRAHGFEVFIVSGGGIDFMRVWSEGVYGVDPPRVVGTSMATKYEVRDGEPVIEREAKLAFVDDKAGKPVGIWSHIGKRPVLAVGNSDGDFEMLEWTTAGDGPRLGVLIHHTDGVREWAYDRDSHVGRLSRGLDEAGSRGWVVVDMARDWSRVWTWE